MTYEIALVLLVILLMMVGLIFGLARPEMIIFISLSVLLLSGILTPDEALKGFANQGMLTIALLYIISGVIQKSGIVDQIMIRLLGSSRSERMTLIRLLFPVSLLSAFINNTPIVATLTPIVRKWCEQKSLSPSKYLIPLSYATILGGTITIIGTSTNLVVHGLLLEMGLTGFSLFQLAIVGIPLTIIGLMYIVFIGYKHLPNYKILTETFNEQSREYLSECIVEPAFPYINQTVEKAGLRQLKGLYLIEIIRGNEKILPVKSTTKIKLGDRLIFTGLISTIAELQKMKGLKVETGSALTLDTLKNGDTHLAEVVISHQSSLLYNKIKDTEFRSKYDAGIVAVHRNSERIKNKVGDITIRPGDTLLLLGGHDFMSRATNSKDFYVVTPLDTPPVLDNVVKGWIALIILLISILLVTFNVLSMFTAMVLSVVILFLTRSITPEEAKKYLQFNVLLLIACTLGIGAALLKTGAAELIATGFLIIAKPLGHLGILISIYLLTSLFTEVITNSAAAVMMLPIGLQIANQLSINPLAIAVLITIAASASFNTPIGYQTNLIVYGPGGYKFYDYFRVGIPLSLISLIITVFIVNIVWVI